uniref:Ig-like domain-containing protein n=1 Tax=Xiphophorus couchianus TaxID=32473 RepID=A0A3B5LHH3_9TELE
NKMLPMQLVFCFCHWKISLAQAQPKQVDAFAGGDVILPCTFNIPANKDIPTVEWSKVVEGPKSVIVFLYRDGCEIFGMKDPDFEYRTNLILRQLQHGNYSLRISELKLSDSGTYQCLIIQKNGKVLFLSTASLSPTSSALPTASVSFPGSRLLCHLIVGIPYLVSTILLGLIYRDRRRETFPASRKKTSDFFGAQVDIFVL